MSDKALGIISDFFNKITDVKEEINQLIDIERKILKIKTVRSDISAEKIMEEVEKIAHASLEKNINVVNRCLDDLYLCACKGEAFWWEKKPKCLG